MRENPSFVNVKKKLTSKQANVGVLGLGYVGLPLAIELAKKGYTVYGIDVNEEKVSHLTQSMSYLSSVSKEDLASLVKQKKFVPTTDFSVISKLDAVSICVPTPLTKHDQPDMTFIMAAVDEIKKHMKRETLIILESTTYPGTTNELIEQALQNEGYKVGEDYFLCFSPERIDPGNQTFETKNTPKVIGGTTPLCTELAMEFYREAITTLIPVSSPMVAEMSKLLENSFRSVNIAFINEMALLAEKLGINIWEVIDAASTKPFGFMAFYPGPGIGGHCIPLDPLYLLWKAKELNFQSRHIELAQEINKKMPNYVVYFVAEVLNRLSKSIKGSNILLLGMTYKPNVADIRESPSLIVYELLKEKGANVEYNDPYIEKFHQNNGEEVRSKKLDYPMLKNYDLVLLLTNHDSYNYDLIEKHAPLILDTRNSFQNKEAKHIVKLGDSLKNKLKEGNSTGEKGGE